ncbi:MAG: hypothetical protein H7Z40_01795 [Phycisphaerae bacterium]|nr:hypothetical protein [Gemmatimonadaceae bacterium]
MRRIVRIFGAAAVLASPMVARAQTPPVTCSSSVGSISPADACQKINDLYQFLAPQIGVALAGGNVMLGESGSLGTPGKSSLVLRLTAVDGFVPSNTINLSASGNAASSDFGAQRAPIPVPSFDAAVSVFQGMAMGLTNIGGLDVLVGLTYVPDVNKDRVSIKTDGRSFAASYGLRLGILQESAVIPGVSVSYRKRKLPTSSFGYTSTDDTLAVNRMGLTSSAWRLVAGKHFKLIGFAGGIGRDDIESTSRFDAVINGPVPAPRLQVSAILARQETKRNTAFFNVSLGLPKAQLIGEMGWSSKGTIQQTVNTFGGHQANEGFRYYTLGLGIRY